jgi:hypothetical protein
VCAVCGYMRIWEGGGVEKLQALSLGGGGGAVAVGGAVSSSEGAEKPLAVGGDGDQGAWLRSLL